MTLMSILTICNNIEHMFVGLTKDPTSDRLGFAIAWNDDHYHYSRMPIVSWETNESCDTDSVIQKLENFLRELLAVYKTQFDKNCPLTDEIVDEIVAEIKERQGVNIGSLLIVKSLEA